MALMALTLPESEPKLDIAKCVFRTDELSRLQTDSLALLDAS